MKIKGIIIITLLLAFGIQASAQNHALYFDGAGDKIGVLDSPELNPSSALTLEAWINAESWAGNIWADVVIGKQGGTPDRGYALTVGQNGRAEFTHSINQAWESVNTGQILGLNSWYHIAGVYDGTSMKIYINGVLQGTKSVSGTLSLSSGIVMNFGENPTWTNRYYNGIIDEIRIWNVARSAQEIAGQMSTPLSGNETGLVGYWPMNEGTGTTLNDMSVNSNSGTMLNMTQSNWVNGFIAPGNDVGVIGIAAPSVIGGGFTSQETVRLDIKNFATDKVTGFDVSYRIGTGSVVTETVTDTIEPFETYIHSFANTVDLSGSNSIMIEAYTSLTGDNNSSNDSITETISQTNNMYLFDQVQHNFGAAGQTHTLPLYMPEDLSGYSEILLHIDLQCPVGGCDPWDQPAKVIVIKDAVSYEIARYITPYGVACGGWTWDITDFKPILSGKTIFESYVQVWGASGWLVSMELELVPGTPEYPYVKLTRLWNEDNWVYGDTAVSYDFPEKTIPINEKTEKAMIRMTMTGHGQGNTMNAAEFSHFSHFIWIDGLLTFEQDLWKDDCQSNSCSPQNGTYTYSRAGWCPGQDVQPWVWDMDGFFNPGDDVVLDFKLAQYTNLLNTGYNGGSHTEPHFRCHSYLIEYSKDNFLDVEEQEIADDHINVFPNPSAGHYTITVDNYLINTIEVFRSDGSLLLSIPSINAWEYQLEITGESKGFYFVKIHTDKGMAVKKIIKH